MTPPCIMAYFKRSFAKSMLSYMRSPKDGILLIASFAFILGCVPLLTAEGAGALARNAIGVVVVVGMSVASLIGVFFIPCSFVFVMKLFRSKIEKAQHGADPDEVSAYAKLEADEHS